MQNYIVVIAIFAKYFIFFKCKATYLNFDTMKNTALSSNNALLSVMDKLKLETKANHTQTEKVSSMKRLFASDYSLTEYCQHLKKVYGYLSVLELLLLQGVSADKLLHEFFLVRRKQAWLKQDLISFGLTEAEILALPKPQPPSYINSLPSCLGVYYVLEGSSLGGQMICQHLTQHFVDATANKLRFYQGYGSETRQKWQQFGTLVNARFPDPQQPEINEIIEAAKLTFDWLADWLKTNPV